MQRPAGGKGWCQEPRRSEKCGPRGRRHQVTRGLKDHPWELTVVLGTWEMYVGS